MILIEVKRSPLTLRNSRVSDPSHLGPTLGPNELSLGPETSGPDVKERDDGYNLFRLLLTT